jgi:hypothetical protein
MRREHFEADVGVDRATDIIGDSSDAAYRGAERRLPAGRATGDEVRAG